MRLTVLGKYGPYPKEGGATSGYLVEEGDTKLVLDMGSGTLSRLIGLVDLKEVDGIYVSHLHNDHVSDLLPLKYALEAFGVKMKIYTAYSDSAIYALLFGSSEFEVVNIKEGDTVQIKDFKLSFYATKHSVVNHSVKIEGGGRTLVYTGDTLLCDKVYEAIEGADCCLADISHRAGSGAPHMTVTHGVALAERFKNTKFLATHIRPEYAPSEAFVGTGIEVVEELNIYEV